MEYVSVYMHKTGGRNPLLQSFITVKRCTAAQVRREEKDQRGGGQEKKQRHGSLH